MTHKEEVRSGKAPSPWAQVADAGFSAVLERRGFERIGKALWRLQGDRVLWHYALYRGINVPRSFREIGGVVVPEHDEIYRKLFGIGSADRVDGAAFDVHFERSLIDAWYDVEERKLPPLQARPEGLGERIANAVGLWVPPPRPRPPDPPFLNKDRYGVESSVWDTRQGQIEDIAETLGRIWDEYYWPVVEPLTTIAGVYSLIWGPGRRRGSSRCAIGAWLVGDRNWLDELERRLVENAAKSLEQHGEDFRMMYAGRMEFSKDHLHDAAMSRLRNAEKSLCKFQVIDNLFRNVAQ